MFAERLQEVEDEMFRTFQASPTFRRLLQRKPALELAPTQIAIAEPLMRAFDICRSVTTCETPRSMQELAETAFGNRREGTNGYAIIVLSELWRLANSGRLSGNAQDQLVKAVERVFFDESTEITEEATKVWLDAVLGVCVIAEAKASLSL